MTTQFRRKWLRNCHDEFCAPAAQILRTLVMANWENDQLLNAFGWDINLKARRAAGFIGYKNEII